MSIVSQTGTLEGVEDEERNLSGLYLLLNLGETWLKIVRHKELSCFLVLLTLVKHVKQNQKLFVFVLMLTLLIEDSKFAPHLLVGFDVRTDDVVTVRYILEEGRLCESVDDCDFHQLRENTDVKADLVLDPAPAFDFFGHTVQIIVS